jgi:hypothetical protein
MLKKISRIVVLLVLVSAFISLGCSHQYQLVSGQYLKNRMIESDRDTVVSWWLLSESKTEYFILEKRTPLDKKYYFKVDKKEVCIHNNSAQKEKYPINLKIKDIEFL